MQMFLKVLAENTLLMDEERQAFCFIVQVISECQSHISCICVQIIVSNSFVCSEPGFVFSVLADVGQISIPAATPK